MSSPSGGHNTPFYLFAKLMDCIPLEDVKHHFKVSPRAFRGDIAIDAMVESLHFGRDEAIECLAGVLLAQLIVNVDKPKDIEFRTKFVYSLSVKGILVLRDVKNKRLHAESPCVTYAPLLHGINTSVKSNIVYLDRDTDGNILYQDVTLSVLFRHALGDKLPNTSNRITETQPLLFIEDTPDTEPQSNNLTPITPLYVQNKVARLKSHTHAFTGTSLVDWLLRNSSVVSRTEAAAVAGAFVDYRWILCVNADDTSSAALPPSPQSHRASLPSSPTMLSVTPAGFAPIKDSSKAIYQPTLAGAKFLNWDLNLDAPATTSAVSGFFGGKKKSEMDIQIQAAGTGGLGRTSDLPRNSTAESRPSNLTRKSSGSNRSELELDVNSSAPTTPASKSLTHLQDGGQDSDADLYGWESCHTHLISMDGTKVMPRSKTASINPAVKDGLPVSSSSSIGAAGSQSMSGSIGTSLTTDGPSTTTSATITKILGFARQKASVLKKQSANEYSAAKCPDLLPMDTATTPRDPLVDANLKERVTHLQRLAQILETPELCEQFRRYNHFMYSQENYSFWKEADTFRRKYSKAGALIIPGEPICYPDSDDPSADDMVPTELVQIVSHAMAIYLKHIVNEAPYEVNVGSTRKKGITSIVACDDLLPFYELINPDCIVSHDVIDTKAVLLPGTESMLAHRLTLIQKTAPIDITASLLDVAENHIFALMATDSVPKFLRTTAYHNTVLEVIKTGSLKNVRNPEDVLRLSKSRSSAIISPTSAGERESRVSIAEGGVDFAKFAAVKRNSQKILLPTKEESLSC